MRDPAGGVSSGSWRRLARGLPVALLLAAALPAALPVPAAAGGSGATVYVHYSTAQNTAWNYTDLDNSVTNDNPNAIVFVTPTWNPSDNVTPAFDYANVGVWYNAGTGRWSIFNEDSSAMPVGAAFNVYALPAASTDGSIIVHQATAANSSFDFSDVDDPLSNGQPGVSPFITPSWNPGGSGGVFDTPPTGVWWNTTSQQWSIFHEDKSAVTVGASFNVYVPDPQVAGLSVASADSTNTYGYYTCFHNPAVDNNPDAIINLTQNWTPFGSGGVFNNDVAAVFYSDSLGQWCVWNEGLTTMSPGASFDLLGSPSVVPAPLTAASSLRAASAKRAVRPAVRMPGLRSIRPAHRAPAAARALLGAPGPGLPGVAGR